MMKLSLQLYESEEGTYLLDFRSIPTRSGDRLQRVESAIGADVYGDGDGEPSESHTMEFFELCALIIGELGR